MSSSGRRPGWPAWATVGLATVALHGCVLEAVWPAWAGQLPAGRPLLVRTLPPSEQPAPSPTAADASSTAPAPAAAEARTTGAPARTRPARSTAAHSPLAARSTPPPATVDASPAAFPETADRPDGVQVASMAEDAGSTPTVDAPTSTSVPAAVPTYRTAPPPATRLFYDLKHGILTGQGEIDWLPAGPRYELKLEGRIASLTLLTQISSGGFDAHGLAPERYTDQRMKRAVNAANLQRGSAKITFSGPDTQYPLLPGTQDRVSWMVQLASIVNAQPELATVGAKVTLFVVGARGEGDVWVFACTGNDTVDTGMGAMPAVKFIREPTKPHDTQVEAWLAPQLHGLPAHARLSNGNDGALDLILREVH